MKFIESLEDLYGTTNLYEVLQIQKDASANEIKRAYYAMSLKVHPDRATDTDRDKATKKFQALSKTYSILSDKDQRAVYDESGEIDDECDAFQEERNWDSYWRLLFHKVTMKDIEKFESKYRNSEEEMTDVLTAYVECEGDMDMILERVPCCTVEDDERFQDIIDQAILEKKVEKYNKYSKETKKKKATRRKRAAAEALEAKQAAEENGMVGGDDELKSILMKRNENRAKEMNNFFDQLEAKYSKPKTAKKNEKKIKKNKKQ